MTDQLTLLLRQLTPSQRIGIVFGALASVFVLVVFVMWAGKPTMEPAFQGLSTSDAAAISQALRTAKVQFEVTDAGTTILVPASSMSDARVAAAAAGVGTDSSTQGFSLFDKSGFGMSEFDQQVTYQRALEGKLTSTIQSMNGVGTATVSIVAAQNGLFADQDKPASASIVVKMRNGQAPDGALVRGIVSAVAGSVAGLSQDNVTVVDESGRVLAGPSTDLAGDAMTTQRTVEGGLSAKIEELVDQALGPGHASVAVSATLDMDKVEQTVTTVAPISQGNWTPTSVQTTEETYAGAGTSGTGGIPGSNSNIPGLPTYPGNLPATSASASPAASPAASASPGASASPAASPSPSASSTTATTADSGYLKRQETVNYNNSQTIEKIIKQPGAIQRLSVAVLLDQAALGSVTPDALKTAITAAIGADATRGDTVAVSAVPFAAATTAASASALPSDLIGTATGVATSVFGVLIALVLLVLVWRNMRALRGRADEMTLVHISATQPELLEGYTSTGERRAIAPVPGFEETPQARIQQQLRTMAEEKPDEIVGLMNSWLRTEKGR